MMKLVVLSCVLAAASASVVGISPLAYSSLGYSGLAYPGLLPYSAAVLPYAGNYRGPLSLAPGQPANVLGADGRPLDTLEVNLDKLQKAASGVHLLKKRSVVAPWISPLAYNAAIRLTAPIAYSAPLLTPYSSNYRGPLSLAPGQPANVLGADGRPLDTLEVNLDKSAHILSKAYDSSIHLLKKRSAPLIAPIAPISPIAPVALAHTPLITPATPITRIAHIAPFGTYAAPYATYW